MTTTKCPKSGVRASLRVCPLSDAKRLTLQITNDGPLPFLQHLIERWTTRVLGSSDPGPRLECIR